MTSPGPGTRFPGDVLMARHDLVLHRLPGFCRKVAILWHGAWMDTARKACAL